MAVPPDLTVLASNLSHLFLTNQPPSESESIDIYRVLALSKDGSVVLGENDRLTLEDLVTKCRAAITCIRRVPPELISKIFTMCVPNHVDDDQPWSTLDLACVPWVLGRVCSLWRAVAISQPALWAFIKIDLEEMAQSGNFEPPLAILETALGRSGRIPLRVFFHDSFTPTVRAQEMLSSLMTHSHRWSQLSIFISYAHLHLTNRVRGRLPLLGYLNIGAYGANTFPSFDGFAIAPMLQEVLVKDEWQALTLPWTQLTSLGGETIESPAPVIRQSPELLRCHFHFPRGPFSQIWAPITQHKKLTHITINVVGFLKGMILPSLQEIIITNSYPFTRNPQVFADFFQHSGSSLRVFTWNQAAIEDPMVFKTILQNIPNLVKLELGLKETAQVDIIVPLTVTQSWCVLPRLESVRIQGDPADAPLQPVIPLFINMVESRWFKSDRNDVTRLREAGITIPPFWNPNSPPTKKRIDVLREQGMLLTFDEFM